MGSYLDDILDGLFCGRCGEVIDGDAPGYPRRCEECEDCSDDNETS